MHLLSKKYGANNMRIKCAFNVHLMRIKCAFSALFREGLVFRIVTLLGRFNGIELGIAEQESHKKNSGL